MTDYGVIIVGGGIAGSIAARDAAKGGLRTLLIEKEKTPREKACSGIQFPYFERIIGETIPPERLCNIELNKVKMYYPDGKSSGAGFQMINFMRKPFDNWLNQIAIRDGAEFRDQCKFTGFEKKGDEIDVTLSNKGVSETLSTNHLIDASGLNPAVRKLMRPEDFAPTSKGATINYYIDGTGDLDRNTLYQFWNLDWNDTMFAWAYMKTLDDGKDYWVVGTGCNTGRVLDRQKLLYEFFKKEFSFRGEIVKREGYSHTIDLSADEKVWLGEDNILMVGDAAGLIDPSRGVGMDAAALSGRLVAQALFKGDSVMKEYSKLMKPLVLQTRRNQSREIGVHKNNEDMQKYLEKSIMFQGLVMMVQKALNKFRPLHKMVMLPP
jgi:flavin-dependent dehydrogenase